MADSLYKRRIADGLCGACGKNPTDGSLCDGCKEKSKQRAAAKRKKFTEAGGCLGCGKPLDVGTRCEKCKADQKRSREKTTAQRKQDGQCTACPEPAKPDCTLCQTCITKRSIVSSERYRQRKEAGTCYFCDNPPEEGYTICAYHRGKYRDYRMALKVEVLIAYGGCFCSLCENDDVAVLEIDHIEGGGRKHFREEGITGGYSFYLWLKNNDYPAGFRVLCPTCNKKAYAELRNAATVG